MKQIQIHTLSFFIWQPVTAPVPLWGNTSPSKPMSRQCLQVSSRRPVNLLTKLHVVYRLRMHGIVLPFPNMSSWTDNFRFFSLTFKHTKKVLVFCMREFIKSSHLWRSVFRMQWHHRNIRTSYCRGTVSSASVALKFVMFVETFRVKWAFAEILWDWSG